MTTITVWLLISVGSDNYAGSPVQVVERFAHARDCESVALAARESRRNAIPVLRCIQATVVKP